MSENLVILAFSVTLMILAMLGMLVRLMIVGKRSFWECR